MAGIAISYRREDTAWITGRIFDRLKSHYASNREGKDNIVVFMDYDSTPIGVDFRSHIMAELDKCEILLAIIGPRWLGDDGKGRKRIDEEADWVRIEIEYALKRKIPVVPVLIDRTPMPRAEDLPASIRDLAYRHAAIVDSQLDFNSHIERLIRQIDQLPGIKPAPRSSENPGRAALPATQTPNPSTQGVRRGAIFALALAGIAALGTAAGYVYLGRHAEQTEPNYISYNSPELGVTLLFPNNIFSLDNTEREQRRLTLRDANGQPMVVVTKLPLPTHRNIQQGRQQEIDDLKRKMYTLTYAAPETERNWTNWYVLSGVVHGRKFYFRRWYTDDGVVSMEFFYSPNLAGLFDKLIPKMTRELKFMTAAY
jgi:hypothetical protein